jgi:uncharacterized protein YutE (UPF0331/DUF86 family)
VTVRPAVVRARLAHLGFVLRQLERLRQVSPAERQREPLHRMAVERGIHVAAEAIFDIGHHLLAGRGLAVPAAYRDVIPALVQAGVLDAATGARLDGMAGLRNILVHDYIAIDESRIWQVLDQHLEDLVLVQQALGAVPELVDPVG